MSERARAGIRGVPGAPVRLRRVDPARQHEGELAADADGHGTPRWDWLGPRSSSVLLARVRRLGLQECLIQFGTLQGAF